MRTFVRVDQYASSDSSTYARGYAHAHTRMHVLDCDNVDEQSSTRHGTSFLQESALSLLPAKQERDEDAFFIKCQRGETAKRRTPAARKTGGKAAQRATLLYKRYHAFPFDSFENRYD